MYGSYKLPAYRQNSKTSQEEREIWTHPLILIENTTRQTQTFVNNFAPFVTNLSIPWFSPEFYFCNTALTFCFLSDKFPITPQLYFDI